MFSQIYTDGFNIGRLFRKSFKKNSGEYIIAVSSDRKKKLQSDIEALSEDGLKKRYPQFERTANCSVQDISERIKTGRYVTVPANIGPLDNHPIWWFLPLGQEKKLPVKYRLSGTNPGLVLKDNSSEEFSGACIINNTPFQDQNNLSGKSSEVVFPLFINNISDDFSALEFIPSVSNFNTEIIKKINISLGLTFQPQPQDGNVCYAANNAEIRDDFKQVYTSFDLLDYIYAMLYSPSYRAQYGRELFTGLPVIPYPADENIFWQLVRLGSQLRQLHTLEHEGLNHVSVRFPIDGNNAITEMPEKERFHPGSSGSDGVAMINSTQYFDGVPASVWDYQILGQFPAREWIKRRAGQILIKDEIIIYRKILAAMAETQNLMKEIDKTLQPFTEKNITSDPL